MAYGNAKHSKRAHYILKLEEERQNRSLDDIRRIRNETIDKCADYILNSNWMDCDILADEIRGLKEEEQMNRDMYDKDVLKTLKRIATALENIEKRIPIEQGKTYFLKSDDTIIYEHKEEDHE